MRAIGIFVVLVFMCSGVLAVSGVSPASYEVDFESGYSGEFVFDFVMEGAGGNGNTDCSGWMDFADFVLGFVSD